MHASTSQRKAAHSQATELQRIKYGVLCAQRLCSDLKHWDTCYISGRLHKPVHILQEDSTILRANEQNLNSALAAGVLLLPPRFTTQASSESQTRCLTPQVCHLSHAVFSLTVSFLRA